MADVAVSERRIRPIQDAIESENWKQALQLCDKWQKKGEKSDKFQAIKAYVLSKQTDSSQHNKGISESVDLCQRTPAVTDLDAIHQIQDTLRGLSLHQAESSKLWERAAAAKSNDADILNEWLDRSMSENDWRSAQKATMAFRKAFPQERKYEFWNIVMCFLVHQDRSSPEKDKFLFSNLAYRLVSKAAELVPKDKAEILSVGKAIQTPEELYFLIKICIGTGHAADAVKWMQSDTFGFQSRFAEQDTQLVATAMLDALEASTTWSDTIKFAEWALINSEKHSTSVNDDHVWKLLFEAPEDVKDSKERLAGISELLDKVLSSRPNDRSARTAKLVLLTRLETSGQDTTELLDSVRDYLDLFGEKRIPLEDIARPFAKLKSEQRRAIVQHLESKLDNAETGVNRDLQQNFLALSLRFLIDIATTKDEDEVMEFAKEGVHLYRMSLESANPIPEAAFLAGAAVLSTSLKSGGHNSFGSGPPQTHLLLKTSMLIESCRRRSNHFYPYNLLLILLQLHLGQVSLAMMNFKKLSIKNLQWETIGHLLLTRISTLHPHQFGKFTPSNDNAFSPLAATDDSLSMLERAGKSLSKQIREGLNCGSYANVVECVGTRDRVGRSISKQISNLEHARISRMLGLADETVVTSRSNLFDNRQDIPYLPTFINPEDSAFTSLNCGPRPMEEWLGARQLFEDITRILKSEITAPQPTITSIEELENTLSSLADEKMSSAQDMTEVEIENWRIHVMIGKAIADSKDKTKGILTDQVKVEDCLANLDSWVKKLQQGTDGNDPSIQGTAFVGKLHVPTWQFLHQSYSSLETLQLLALFAAVLAKKSKTKSKTFKLPKERISSLQNNVVAAQGAIHKAAQHLKDELNAEGVLEELMRCLYESEDDDSEAGCKPGGLVKEIDALIDRADMETFCGSMRESWEEALDGVIAIKIKMYK